MQGLIKFYQVSLGRIVGGNCRYYPSCSHYALEAYQKHPGPVATKLMLLRILRCHPFASTQGFDPVPEANFKGNNYEQ